MTTPDYCFPFEDYAVAPDPCPLCGASQSGKDPVRGVCQARYSGPAPRSILDLVLVDKRSGEIVASTPVLKS